MTHARATERPLSRPNGSHRGNYATGSLFGPQIAKTRGKR